MGLIETSQQHYYDSDDHGKYQFVSLKDIINQFLLIYVGEDKIIPSARKLDVAFHAQRALAELSFDTFKSCKSQEITIPATLQMILPQDYVNYTKVSWVDSAGIKHLIYPTSKTSNPSFTPYQNTDGEYKIQAIGTVDDDSDPTVAGKIVLDGEYKDIVYGMYVTGPYLGFGPTNAGVTPPQQWRVIETSNSGGITTITVGVISPLATISDLAVAPTDAFSNALLTFYPPSSTANIYDGNTSQRRNTVILENVSWGITSFLIQGNSTSTGIDDLEVGMLVHHKSFVQGTTVLFIDIDNNEIVLSNPAGTSSPGGGSYDSELSFSSDKVDSKTWANYKSSSPSENQDDYQDNTYWPANGERYGLDPQHAQANGSFYIDCSSGKIHFSSNMNGKTIILDYISDSLGTDAEMQVHKFAEEAMYKWMSHAILSGRANIPEYQVNRFKKERFAAIRQAKLRLSNIKLEEITQILRGKSKQIKH